MKTTQGISRWLVGLTLIFSLSSPVLAHDLVWPGEKLKALYPQAESFEQKNLYVSDQQRQAIEKELGAKLQEEDLKPSIYLAVVRSAPDSPPRKAGAIMFIDAHGDGGKIEMGVVVSGTGELAGVLIFENQERPEISGRKFLAQFAGKKSSQPFRVGGDILSPAGLERTAQAVANGAKRGMLIILELFRKR